MDNDDTSLTAAALKNGDDGEVPEVGETIDGAAGGSGRVVAIRETTCG